MTFNQTNQNDGDVNNAPAPRLIRFDIWNEDREPSAVWINPADVCDVREYQDRHAYGGWNPVSDVSLRCGLTYKVHGHAARQLTDQ